MQDKPTEFNKMQYKKGTDHGLIFHITINT